MKKRLKTLLFLPLVLFIGCDFSSMDYVPDKELVKRNFKEFLSSPRDIEGIYGNLDVDSVIFRYPSDDEKVLNTIKRQAALKDWKILKSNCYRLQLFRK